MYDIAICDDNSADRAFLNNRILRNGIGKTEIRIHEYDSGDALLEEMKNIDFSLIFLDIQMDGMCGNETALRVRGENCLAVLVFYSGLPNPTPQNFEFDPYRYITKSMPIEKIDEYIEASIMRMVKEKEKPMLMVKANRSQYQIPLDYILYLEKYKRGTRVFIVEEIYKTYKIESNQNDPFPVLRAMDKMETLSKNLVKYGFGSPHNSYIINIKHLHECSNQHLTLTGVDHVFPISRGKSKEFMTIRDKFFRSKYV